MDEQGHIDKNGIDIPVDIFEHENKMRVIAELSEVNEEDIRLDFCQDILVIFASQGSHRHHKEIKLPRAAERIVWKSFRSGVLEVVLS